MNPATPASVRKKAAMNSVEVMLIEETLAQMRNSIELLISMAADGCFMSTYSPTLVRNIAKIAARYEMNLFEKMLPVHLHHRIPNIHLKPPANL
jgi:methionine synthase I (cobalamin-dependent)